MYLQKEKNPYTWNEISLNVHVSDIICLMIIVVLKELFMAVEAIAARMRFQG